MPTLTDAIAMFRCVALLVSNVSACRAARLLGAERVVARKPDVGGHHQQAVHEPQRAAFGVLPSFAEQIPRAGDGVDAEEADDAGADDGVGGLLAAIVGALYSDWPSATSAANSGNVAKLAYL